MAKDGEIRLAGGGPRFSLDDFRPEIRAQLTSAMEGDRPPEPAGIKCPPNGKIGPRAARRRQNMPAPREWTLAGAAGRLCGRLVVNLRTPVGRVLVLLAIAVWAVWVLHGVK